MGKHLFLLALVLCTFGTKAQSESSDSTNSLFDNLAHQVFLPSIEVGYLFNSADALSNGILTKTSIEYRLMRFNHMFVRANYDTYKADFELSPENDLTNVIKGTATFTDLLFGLGYRFGEGQWSGFLMFQPGVRYYNFPEFVQTGNVTNIEQGNSNLFTTRATLGIEYYLTNKSALSFDLIQSHIWNNVDFWEDSGAAYGFSLGFITALY